MERKQIAARRKRTNESSRTPQYETNMELPKELKQTKTNKKTPLKN